MFGGTLFVFCAVRVATIAAAAVETGILARAVITVPAGDITAAAEEAAKTSTAEIKTARPRAARR